MKLALTMKRSDLQSLDPVFPNSHSIDDPVMLMGDLGDKFFQLPTALVDREICETNPYYVQLIPYVILHNVDSGKVFMYSRGKGGNEARLHGKCSIGVGGHIDIAPSDTEDLLTVIAKEARRELLEEVGLELPGSATLKTLIETTAFMVYTNATAVDNVHLGICFVLPVIDQNLKNMEAGVITNHQWVNLSDINAMLTDDSGIELETWSAAIVEHFCQSLTT